MASVVKQQHAQQVAATKRPDEIFQTMSSILEKCQNSVASHPKLIAQMKQLYAQTDFELFTEKLIKCLRSTLIVIQKNTNIDRCLDFIAKFTAGLTTKSSVSSQTPKGENGAGGDSTLVEMENDDNDREEDDDHFENPLFTHLIDFLIQCSTYSYDAVRYRSCQMLGLMMAAVNNDQFIDEEIYFRLLDALLERLKDINSRVQIQAIAAIYRLQDPVERECRVIKALSYLINYDPNWQVRYQALGHIAYSKQTLSDIIDRVKDPSPHVRKKALLILSEKVLIKFISIERRLFILNYSLNDSDESVLEVACRKLLPSWLTFKENDMCKLLKALDVVDATQTCELMLDRMHNDDGSLESAVAEFAPHLLNEKLVIPMEKLNAESAFFWCWICAKCKSGSSQRSQTGDQIVNDKNEQQNEGQNYLDKLLPSLTEFCEYFRQVLNKIQQDQAEKSMDDRQIIENTFILRQLLRIFNYVDFSDVHGKKTLLKLCHELLSRRDNDQLFENVISVYKLLNPNVQQRINEIVELISDIREPQTQQQKAATAMAAATNGAMQQQSGSEVPMDIPDESTTVPTSSRLIQDDEPPVIQIDPHEIKMKISELKFKRFNLKEAFENIYKEIKLVDKEVDMKKLAELRESIRACEDEISSLQAKLDGSAMQPPPPPPAQPVSVDELSPIKAQPAVVAAVQPVIVVDPTEATAHCLRLALCLLTDPDLKNLTPQLRSLSDTLILPNIGSVNEDLRALATRALSLICLLKLDMAQKYIHLLIKIMEKDKKEIVVEAFTGIINCIMAFSINKLITASSDIELDTSSSAGVGDDESRVPEPESASIEHQQRIVSKILSQMAALLDNEDSEVSTRAVEGFCKLYMTGHILSAKLFSKLLIMYFSPLTEHDVRLRSVLSNFLPQFAFLRATNQVCVEESFMITLKHLINAPPETHLAEIDLMKVMELLLQLTNPKNLIQQRRLGIARQTNNICHENIVKSICMELLKDGNAFRCKTYLKIAQLADLGDADYHSLKNIWQLAEQVHEHIDDRTNKKTAKKFVESIESLLTKMPEYIEEQERKKMQTEQQPQDTAASDQTSERANIISQNTDATQQETNKKEKNKKKEDNSDDEDEGSGSNSPKLLDPMFKRINKKAKTDKSKPAPTTTTTKKSTRAASSSSNKTPATSRVSSSFAAESSPSRSTRSKQATQQKLDDSTTSSVLNTTTKSQKEDTTVINTSAVIPETPPTVSRMSSRHRAQSKTTEEPSQIEPKSSTNKTLNRKTPVKTNETDEANKSASLTRHRSTRSQTVENAKRGESPKETTVKQVQIGVSRIQITRASSTNNRNAATDGNKSTVSKASSTSTKETDYEPPTKVSRSSVNTRVSSREKEKQSLAETRLRMTRSSSGHKKTSTK